MQTTSTEFYNKINSLSQTACLKASLTYKNAAGETVTEELTELDFFGDGVKTVSDCMSSGDFTFGGTVCKEMTCVLDNTKEKYYGCNFTDGKLIVYSGLVLDDGSEEYVKLGEFNLSKAGKPATTVKLTGYDNMLKFDKTIGILNVAPSSVQALINAACSACGVGYAGSVFANSDASISFEIDNGMTWRELIGCCAAVAGGFARINRDGLLEIVPFSKDNAYEIDPAKTRLSIEVEDHHEITGLIYYGKTSAIEYGTNEFPIIIEENAVFEMMADGVLKGVLEGLYNKYKGHVYCGFTLDYLGNPALDEGDYLYLPSAQGDNVYALCGKCEFKHMGKSTLSCPQVSFYDKQYEQGNRETKTEPSGPEEINENLLLTSLFIKPFFPRNYVQQSTAYPIESLQLDMLTTSSGASSGLAKVWLPFQDLEPDTTYTFSVLLRSYSNKNQKLALAMINYANGADIFQVVGKDNLPLDAAMSEVIKGTSPWLGTGVAFNFGEIQLTDTVWNWHTLTFTTPSTDALAYDIGNYILCLGVNQALTSLSGNTYKVFIQKAKLEKGSMATEWCLGKSESIEGNFVYQEQNGIKLIKKTNTAVVKSNISDYESRTLHLMPCIRLYDALHGVTQICYQEKRNVAGNTTGEDLIVPEITFCTNNNMYGSANTARLFMDENKAIRVIAPGGLYLNDTQIS